MTAGARRQVKTPVRRAWALLVDLPKEEAFAAVQEPAQKWDENDERVPWPMAVALGQTALDHDFIEWVWLPDSGGTAADYLCDTTGSKIQMSQNQKDNLDHTEGLLIYISTDLDDERLSRTPSAPFRYLGDFVVGDYPNDVPASSVSSRIQLAASTINRTNNPANIPAAPDPLRTKTGLKIFLGSSLLIAAFVWTGYHILNGVT